VLAASDIMVMPSIIEGLPNAILEAMAAGLPVVATDVGGHPEVIDDGRTGIIVPPEDGQALVRAMTRLGDDPELCRRMGSAGREKMMAEFTDREMDAKFSNLFEEWHARCSRKGAAGRAAE
jgi:glycosyltransferase involved in cell wall biosynthesis